MNLTIKYDFLPKHPSTRASQVMDHFGIDFETGQHVIAEDFELPLEPGDLVCFTGASGSGKSSLMNAAAAQLPHVIDIDTLDLGERILIDALNGSADDAMQSLAGCGLGEAQLLLRTPHELSDGQRYRFRLALAISHAQQFDEPCWILADEFTATLDRTLAKVVSFNVRRLANRLRVGFLLATTHEDVIDDLQPSLHVQCRLDGEITITRGTPGKKHSACSTPAGSVPRPKRTGRTSLAGIIDHITSASPNS